MVWEVFKEQCNLWINMSEQMEWTFKCMQRASFGRLEGFFRLFQGEIDPGEVRF